MTAEEIKERRLKLEMTQSQLAEVLGVALNTVSRWELGTSRPEGAKMLNLALTQLEWQKTLEDSRLTGEIRASLQQLEKTRYELEKLVVESEKSVFQQRAKRPLLKPKKRAPK